MPRDAEVVDAAMSFDSAATRDVERDAALSSNATATSSKPDADVVVSVDQDAQSSLTSSASLDAGGSSQDADVPSCTGGFHLVDGACELAPRVEAGADYGNVGPSGHTCVVTKAGAVACWGDNSHAQCGLAYTNDASFALLDEPGEAPYTVTLDVRAQAVALGHGSTCALQESGEVACWGILPSKADDTGSEGVPALHRELTAFEAPAKQVALSSTTGAACVRLENGQVWCWGANDYSIVGDASAGSVASAPQPIPGVEQATWLSLGSRHACAVDDGRVRCWGSGPNGELGPGEDLVLDDPGEVPNTVNLEAEASRVDAGQHASCAVLVNGSVWCWGVKTTNGSSATGPTPVRIPLSGAAVDVSTGSQYACARLTNGLVNCWGAPYWIPTEEAAASGDIWSLDLGQDFATHLSVSNFHVCVTLATNRVRCWGSGESGQLGAPQTESIDESVTIQVPGY